jgi:hypothetical protein
VLEAELGPIAMPANLDPAAIRAGIEAHVRSLNLACRSWRWSGAAETKADLRARNGSKLERLLTLCLPGATA